MKYTIQNIKTNKNIYIKCSSQSQWEKLKTSVPNSNTTSDFYSNGWYSFIDGKWYSGGMFEGGDFGIEFEDVDFGKKSLLEQAKEKYPTGTKFGCVKDGEKNISNTDYFILSGDSVYMRTPSSSYNQYLYFDGKWATILSPKPTSSFPEKWALRTNYKKEEIVGWLNKNKQTDSYYTTGGMNTFVCFPAIGAFHLHNTLPDGYTEITFEQFEKQYLSSPTPKFSEAITNPSKPIPLKPIPSKPQIEQSFDEPVIMKQHKPKFKLVTV